MVPVNAIKAYVGMEVQLRSFELWHFDMTDQLHYPAALPPGIIHPYSLNSRLGGLQTQNGLFGEEISVLPVLGNEPQLLRRPGRGLVTALTAIWQLGTCRLNTLSASVYPS
jgi:hypothetical protein